MRDYKKEYASYHSTEGAKKQRAERNKARGMMERAGVVKKGDGKDVDHKKPLSKAYMDVNGTGLVWVTVTMFGKPMTCMLPVMNHRNQPIPAPDAFQVNTAIMRCMTKALALHGLGLYIYSGDDLPMQDAEVITKADTAEVEAMVTKAIEKAVETGDADLANKELFADGMIKYCDICKDMGALKSYWKANQGQLDDLKRSHNDLYKKVLAHFTNVKKTFNEQEKSNGI